MKIKRSEAVAFLVDLGFAKAGEWDDEKILARIEQVPGRVTKDAVLASFVPLFEKIEECGGKGIELLADEKKDAEKNEKDADNGEKSDKSDKTAKPAKAGKTAKPAAKPAKAGKTAKPAAKPAKAKKPAREKKVVEKDVYGSAIGTVRSAINQTFSKDWKTDAEIAKEAGVTLRQARIRLRRAKKSGLLEKERLIRYRLTEKASKLKK